MKKLLTTLVCLGTVGSALAETVQINTVGLSVTNGQEIAPNLSLGEVKIIVVALEGEGNNASVETASAIHRDLNLALAITQIAKEARNGDQTALGCLSFIVEAIGQNVEKSPILKTVHPKMKSAVAKIVKVAQAPSDPKVKPKEPEPEPEEVVGTKELAQN